MSKRVFVVGVGMTKFERPGDPTRHYTDMGAQAVSRAVEDSGVALTAIEQAFAGYCSGPSTRGQRVLLDVGLHDIPVVNVNNNCSTGSSALYLAAQAVRGGVSDCALAVGFEKMAPGAIPTTEDEEPSPLDPHFQLMEKVYGPLTDAPPNAQVFGNAGREHMERYGSQPEHFAWIGWKNHKHSVNNPYAQFQREYSLDEVKNSRDIYAPLTLLQCSPTSDGAGAAVVAGEDFVREHDLWDRAVEILGQAMATDGPGVFDSGSCIEMVGFGMSRRAGAQALAQAGHTVDDMDVVELHDCFSTNELLTYEALGMAEVGKGHELVEAEATTYGGKWVVNPSGGLISKGHPLGATGLAQCSELVWQLRGQAGARQVEGAELALQHNLGLGGACVATVYGRPVEASA